MLEISELREATGVTLNDFASNKALAQRFADDELEVAGPEALASVEGARTKRPATCLMAPYVAGLDDVCWPTWVVEEQSPGLEHQWRLRPKHSQTEFWVTTLDPATRGTEWRMLKRGGSLLRWTKSVPAAGSARAAQPLQRAATEPARAADLRRAVRARVEKAPD